MAGYLGNKPKLANYAVDEFTTSAAQASSGNFTLSQTVTDERSLEVSVGGIDQPQSAYTVTGTTLAFGASIVAENDIVIARHAGESLMYPTLEAGAVTETKIAAGAVTDGKIAGMAATKLTGTVTDAQIAAVAATKLTGSIADARIPASAVTQHVTATDLTPLRQDIAMLALYNAVSDNRAAYNLPSSFIDQFEDDSGLTTQTDVDRDATGEYVSSITSGAGAQHTVTKVGSVSRSSTQSKFGGYSMYCSGAGQGLSFPNHTDFDFGAGDWTVEYWIYPTTVGKHHVSRDNQPYPAYLIGEANNTFYASSTGSSWTPINNMNMSSETLNTWQHYAVVREGNVWTTYKDGTRIATVTASGSLINRGGAVIIAGAASFDYLGYMDEVRISKGIARYSGASFTLATGQHVTDSYTSLLLHMDDTGLVDSSGYSTTTSATGTLISDTQTATGTVTKMSGVILYKDNAGTATLGTDLVISLSANNGTNWTDITASNQYEVVTPVFSTGIKMVRIKEQTVTSGTAPVIKAVWANQVATITGPGYETGDRRSSITLTYSGFTFAGGTPNGMLDGVSNAYGISSWPTAMTPSAGAYLRFQFSSAKRVIENKWYQNTTHSGATWKWQGSNDATSWTDIGSSFQMTCSVANAGEVNTQMSGNTNAYTYYQMLYVSGANSSSPYWQEIEFKIGDTEGKETQLHGWAMNY